MTYFSSRDGHRVPEMFAGSEEYLLESISPDDGITPQSLSPAHDPDSFNTIAMH